MKWKRGKFTERALNGEAIGHDVSGYVFGHLIVHRYCTKYWQISHINSGFAVASGRNAFRTLALAKACAEYVAKLTDWSLDTVTLQTWADGAEARKVYDAIRRFILNPQSPPEPVNILAITDELGLRVVSYLNKHSDCGKYWLPRDVVGLDGKTLIVWRPAGKDSGYAVDGWHPWHDGMHGGCNETYIGALSWVQRAKDIRAGKAKDFSGR
jgi:hypothetical protein